MENLNKKLAELTKEYSPGYFNRNPGNVPDYLSDWNLTMPLAHENGLVCDFSKKCVVYDLTIAFVTDENPLKAIVKCLIDKLESEK